MRMRKLFSTQHVDFIVPEKVGEIIRTKLKLKRKTNLNSNLTVNELVSFVTQVQLA